MKQVPVFLIAMAIGSAALGLACSEKKSAESTAEHTSEEPKVEHMVLGEYVSLEDTLPRIRYFEGGQISINDRCAVRKVKLNPKMMPIYVNGQPVGFC